MKLELLSTRLRAAADEVGHGIASPGTSGLMREAAEALERHLLNRLGDELRAAPSHGAPTMKDALRMLGDVSDDGVGFKADPSSTVPPACRTATLAEALSILKARFQLSPAEKRDIDEAIRCIVSFDGVTDAMVDTALEAAKGAMVDTRRFWTDDDRASVRAMLEAVIEASAPRSAIAPTEYDCTICGGKVHGPFVEPTNKDIMRGSPTGARFKPTHRHAEGGLYQVIGKFVKVKAGKDSWVVGVRYRNAEGMEFIRTLTEFDERMTGVTSDGGNDG